MEWSTPALEPASTTPAPDPVTGDVAPERHGPSLRRMVMTAGLAGMLLVAGGVAAVSAASPDPSTAPGTTAPSGKPSHNSADCPNMGGSGGGSGGSSTAPSAPAPSPAT